MMLVAKEPTDINYTSLSEENEQHWINQVYVNKLLDPSTATEKIRQHFEVGRRMGKIEKPEALAEVVEDEEENIPF